MAGRDPEGNTSAAGPSAPRAAEKKWLNVVLDIDETFLQFGEKVDFDALLPSPEREKYTIVGNFILRPGFDEFFTWLSQNCNTVNLWTLSDDEYADGVRKLIERRVPGLKINLVLDDKANDEATELYGGRKNLKYIWNQKEWCRKLNSTNTVLIDDLSKSTEGDNSQNGIWIPQFSPLGKSQKKAEHGGRKRAGPYVDFSDDHVLADVIDVLKGLTPPSRPFPERRRVDGIHRPDEDITHAGGRRRKTYRKHKGRKARPTRKTKTRR